MGDVIEMDPTKADMELNGKKVMLGYKVFPGDEYSDGEAARPLFRCATR